MTKNNKQKIIVILGPNASGKSDLGVKIALRLRSGRAKKFGGEIISADSRQVYCGMDIGTGKVTKKEMGGIPHHLLDVASPQRDFNVSHFQKLAGKKIKEIAGSGKLPIIVGGTGFWIDALIYGFRLPEVKPNKKLRARLEKKDASELFIQLSKLDPKRAQTIDYNNKRRLIRAIEIVLATHKKIPELKKDWIYNTLFIGVKWPREKLEKRIHERLLKRLDSGMVREIKKLHKSGVSWRRLDNFGLEYRYISRYLRGKLDYDEMVAELFKAIKNYAKRQMTWFKRNSNVKWVNKSEEAIKLAKKFI